MYLYNGLFSSVLFLSCVQLFVDPWIVACQAPLSMKFSRQGYWTGMPFPTPGFSLKKEGKYDTWYDMDEP